MHILHGTWIPQPTGDFVQSGHFCLWVETDENSRRRREGHPRHLFEPDLVPLLTNELGIKPSSYHPLEDNIAPKHFLLPTVDDEPLPSLEMSRYLEIDLPDSFDWQYWGVDSYVIKDNTTLISTLSDLHFLATYNLTEDRKSVV